MYSSQLRAPLSPNYENLSVKLHKETKDLVLKLGKIILMIEVSSSTKCYIINLAVRGRIARVTVVCQCVLPGQMV